MSQHVKIKGHFLIEGRILVNPGSVVTLEEDQAKEFVRRGLGERHPGPAFNAPPRGYADGDEEAGAPGKPEKQDLGSRLATAERAVSRRAQPAGAM